MIADIPGLIEGAHGGAGLGDRFLGHIERCGVLLHLVDGTDEAFCENYDMVRQELAAYGAGLGDKRELVALSKCDALDEDAMAERVAALAGHCGREVIALSSASSLGVPETLRKLRDAIAEARASEAEAAE